MKIKAIVLANFRPYRDLVRIDVEDFTAFIGRNDAGKSSVLEALEIFFNQEIIKTRTIRCKCEIQFPEGAYRLRFYGFASGEYCTR